MLQDDEIILNDFHFIRVAAGPIQFHRLGEEIKKAHSKIQNIHTGRQELITPPPEPSSTLSVRPADSGYHSAANDVVSGGLKIETVRQ